MQEPIRQISSFTIGAARPVASVALAVFAAHALNLEDTWWAAISALMVMQENFGKSVYRGLLRMGGTIIGALAAFALGPVIAHHLILFTLVMGVVTWGCLFSALVFRHSYAWVLALVTFVMVACEAVSPQGHLGEFAVERVANVAVGIAAGLLVIGLVEVRAIFAAMLRQDRWRAISMPVSGRLSETPIDRHDAVLHAMHGAIAMIILSVAVSLWQLGSLAQGMVTTIAVLIVPLDPGLATSHTLVVQRMAQRFIGCLLAGCITFALFPLIEGKPLWCQLVLCLGVSGGTYLQTAAPRLSYMAVQFTVAFLMVFVQDQGWTIDERPALERLAGVLAGIATLYAVFMVFRSQLRQS